MVSFLRLSSIFSPAFGEGLLSWLTRLCAENRLSTSEFTADIVGRDPREFAALATRDEHALALEILTGMEAANIRLMMHSSKHPQTTNFFDQPIWWSALERTKRRIAPGRCRRDQSAVFACFMVHSSDQM